MSEFTADVHARDRVSVVELHGDLDGRADGPINVAYAQATATEPDAVVLDFEHVGYINSTGIALIVGLIAQARMTATSIRVSSLSDHYRHIFDITRLADFMSFFPDSQAAVADDPAAPTAVD
jgi:anti-anti-sigma factor